MNIKGLMNDIEALATSGITNKEVKKVLEKQRKASMDALEKAGK